MKKTFDLYKTASCSLPAPVLCSPCLLMRIHGELDDISTSTKHSRASFFLY